MDRFRDTRICRADWAKAAATYLVLLGLTACSGGGLVADDHLEPKTAPRPAAPPVDMAGRWTLTAISGGSCIMTFGSGPGTASAVQGTIAPEGGCPGDFFTSRNWNFQDGMLNIRDFKGQPLAQFSYSGGHFQGKDTSGGALTLSRADQNSHGSTRRSSWIELARERERAVQLN